jgi:hypothetical protein
MKTKKYYLILAIATSILYVPALGEIEFLSPSYMPALPDLSESAGIVVMISPRASNIDGLVLGELHDEVLQRIVKAGIKRYSGPIRGSIMHLNMPVSILRVNIDMLKLDDLQQYVLRIQTSLAAEVSLADEPKRYMKADIWWGQPAMQIVSIKDTPAKVTEVILQQVDSFVESYLAANPQGGQAPAANNVSIAPKEQVKPAAKSVVAKYKYVASKNSKVFHKPECSSAKRILQKNLVSYNRRDEALKAGKRPCKICKP